jgi:hypothetical protein
MTLARSLVCGLHGFVLANHIAINAPTRKDPNHHDGAFGSNQDESDSEVPHSEAPLGRVDPLEPSNIPSTRLCVAPYGVDHSIELSVVEPVEIVHRLGQPNDLIWPPHRWRSLLICADVFHLPSR